MNLLRPLLAGVATLLFAAATFAAEGQPLGEEKWHPKAIAFGIAIYYLSPPATDPVAQAKSLAANKRYGLHVVDKLDKGAQKTAQLRIFSSKNVAKDITPPSVELLRYFGRGLTKEQAEALQKAPLAIALSFAHPGAERTTGVLRAQTFALELARNRNVIIWDPESREAFTPQKWEEIRLKSWANGVPDVSRQTVIHAYNNDDRTRAITLGMSRFGLPDIVINDTVWSLNQALGSAMNAVTQQLLESGSPDAKGLLNIQINGIHHEGVRQRLKEAILPGGKGAASVRLLEVKAEKGDPENYLLGLNFDTYAGKDVTARQVEFVKTLFGVQPSEVISRKANDKELLAASERARAKLPQLQQAFEKGLQPGEFIMLKVPFETTNGGTEWMWIEVTAWKSGRIKGMLRNEPLYVRGLKAGQMVDAREVDVFDYLRISPDGKRDGDETSKLLKGK